MKEEEDAGASKKYDIQKICRCCLKTVEKEDRIDIFELRPHESRMISYMAQFTLITQLEVNWEDGLPKQLCPSCVEIIDAAYDLRISAAKNEKELKAYITVQPPVPVKGYLNVEALDEVKSELDDDYDDNVEPLTDTHYSSIKVLIKNEPKSPLPVANSESVESMQSTKVTEPNNANTVETLIEQKSKSLNKQFQCHHCNARVSSKIALRNHLRSHIEDRLQHCEKCNKGFNNELQLQRHLKQHGEVRKCSYCGSMFDMFKTYRMHINENHADVVEAEKAKKKNLKLRLPEIKPKKASEKKILCKICDTKLQTILELREHLQQHEDPYNLAAIDLIQNLQLFDQSDLPTPISQEALMALVMTNFHAGQLDRFYQIISKDGLEKALSDSDSDDDTVVETPRRRTHLRCSKCFKSFLRERDIMSHMTADHDMVIFNDKCETCGRQFPCHDLLQRHLRNHCENLRKVHVCEFCHIRFMWKDSLQTHHKAHHATETEMRRFVCNTCSKAFIRAEHLERHKRTHDPSGKKFECLKCKKRFNRKDNLKSHMKTHEDKTEKSDNVSQYLCTYCGRAFSNSSNLIVHVRRHTGEKPYKCTECNRGFPRKTDLQCHARIHSGERPCLCTVCGKKFSRSNKLVRHMRIHLGIKPYTCPHCDKAFTQSNDLTLHIRRHTGSKPYGCGDCKTRFIQGTQLKAHQRATGHTTEDPNNPNLYNTLSVNNPHRSTNGRKEVIVEETKIRPVSRKRATIPKKSIYVEQKQSEIKVESTSSTATGLALITRSVDQTIHLDNIDLATLTSADGVQAGANYGLALLPNGTMIMSQIDMPTIFQLSP